MSSYTVSVLYTYVVYTVGIQQKSYFFSFIIILNHWLNLNIGRCLKHSWVRCKIKWIYGPCSPNAGVDPRSLHFRTPSQPARAYKQTCVKPALYLMVCFRCLDPAMHACRSCIFIFIMSGSQKACDQSVSCTIAEKLNKLNTYNKLLQATKHNPRTKQIYNLNIRCNHQFPFFSF